MSGNKGKNAGRKTSSHFFGGRNKQKKSAEASPAEAVRRLKDLEDMLSKKSEYLEAKIERELEVVRKNLSRNKRLALQALRRKRRYEKQLHQLDSVLSTVESQLDTLESTATNAEVMKVMTMASTALKVHQKSSSKDIDKINDTLDDIADCRELEQEITDALGRSIDEEDIDEDELMEELLALQLEDGEAAKEASGASAGANLRRAGTAPAASRRVRVAPEELKVTPGSRVEGLASSGMTNSSGSKNFGKLSRKQKMKEAEQKEIRQLATWAS